MIRIHRGNCTTDLQETLEDRTRKAVEAFNEHGLEGKNFRGLLSSGYQDARNRLFRGQHRKCCYCEGKPGLTGQPVEHVRPKSEAVRAGITDRRRYWWLAWHWQNLLFACHRCNTAKSAKYPLQGDPLALPGTSTTPYPLPASCLDLSSESPLLIDPSRSDPLDHLCWRPVDQSDVPSRWRWKVSCRSSVGQATIQNIKLSELDDDVTDHLRRSVVPNVQKTAEALTDGDTDEARGHWNEVQELHLQPLDRPFRGATWSVLIYLHQRLLNSPESLVLPTRPECRPPHSIS